MTREKEPKYKTGDKVLFPLCERPAAIISVDLGNYPWIYCVAIDDTPGLAGGWFTEEDIKPYDRNNDVKQKPEFNLGDEVVGDDGVYKVVDIIEEDGKQFYKLRKGECKEKLIPLSDVSTLNKKTNNGIKVNNNVDPIRLKAATAAMQGILANPNIIMSCGGMEDNQEYITKYAVSYADALLAEINRKGGGDERK